MKSKFRIGDLVETNISSFKRTGIVIEKAYDERVYKVFNKKLRWISKIFVISNPYGSIEAYFEDSLNKI